MKKRVSIILLVLLLVCSLTSCWGRDDLAHITETWIPEQDDNVTVLSHHENKILLNGEWFEIGSCVDEYFSNFYVYHDHIIICINGYDVYGVNEYWIDGEWRGDWIFYRINIQTNELEILYSVDQYGNPEKKFPDAYVKNAVVYINDRVRTVVYDTNSKKLEELTNEAFGEPYMPYPGYCIAPEQKYSCEGRDDTSIAIKNSDGEIRYISFDYIADRHEYFNQIREYWKDLGKNPFKKDITPQNIFDGSRIYILDDRIYIRAYMPDKEGDLTSVIIHYDFESDEFHYLYHEYSGGYEQTKVVPVY